jgi:hypothetical protein
MIIIARCRPRISGDLLVEIACRTMRCLIVLVKKGELDKGLVYDGERVCVTDIKVYSMSTNTLAVRPGCR